MSEDFYKTHILPYSGIIVKICRAYSNSQEDFEDYYQEVCLQIWRSRNKFQGKSQWSTWIYRISLNICLTLLKQENRKQANYTLTENLPDKAVEDSKAFTSESLNKLYAAIRKLSETDRAVILLYLEEHSHKEIAEIIGTNANNIGVRVNRIKERLKKLMTQN